MTNILIAFLYVLYSLTCISICLLMVCIVIGRIAALKKNSSDKNLQPKEDKKKEHVYLMSVTNIFSLYVLSLGLTVAERGIAGMVKNGSEDFSLSTILFFTALSAIVLSGIANIIKQKAFHQIILKICELLGYK